MPTRDLANRRVSLFVGLGNSLSNLEAPPLSEAALLKMISPAVRWDGYDLGMQESDQVDDRSLDDEAGAVLRGFAQFGGGLPVFYPKASDNTSILYQAYAIFRETRSDLIFMERVGFEFTKTPLAAGDNVNVYRVMNDGFNPDTEGDGGYAYIVTLLPKGDVYPWTIIPSSPAAQVTIVGAATAALAVGEVTLRGAQYIGNNITARGTWASSDPLVCPVDTHGVIGPALATGTANITCTFPGGTASAPIVVTVA